MNSALTLLYAAAALFLFIHLAISGTTLRDRIVSAIGENVYLGLFSLASLGGIIWLATAYNTAAAEAPAALWTTSEATRWAAVGLTALGFLLAVPGLLTANPTALKQEKALDQSALPGILKITRHPFLWGVFFWSLAHLLVNGDLPSLVLFGTFFILTILGTRSIDAKRRRALGARWEPFAAATSNVPLAALLSGRARVGIGDLPWLKFLLALVVFGLLAHFHGALFGVAALPAL